MRTQEDKYCNTFVPLIYDCNDNCISCPVRRRKYMKNPSLRDVKKKIDKILSISNHIELNGGEPTLRKDLLKILKYIEEKNPKEITLLTNAQRFCYEQYAKKIVEVKNLKIITTLYGHNSRIHDAITRTPGSFNYKIAGIKNLVKLNVPVELRILIHKMNCEYLNNIADFLIENFTSNDFCRIVILNPKLTNTAKKHQGVVAEKITKLSSFLEKPLQKLIGKGYKVRLFHFPHCILPKALWKCSHGVTATDTEVVFIDKCKACTKKHECSKIWKSYLEIFGTDEFKPIK